MVYLVADLCSALSSLTGKAGTIRDLAVPDLREIFWSRADEMVMGKKYRTSVPTGSQPLLRSATYSRAE